MPTWEELKKKFDDEVMLQSLGNTEEEVVNSYQTKLLQLYDSWVSCSPPTVD